MQSFTDLHGNTLKPFVEKYKIAKNQKGRDEILKNAAKAVRQSVDAMEDGSVKLPKDLPLVSSLYLFLFPVHQFSPMQAIARFVKKIIEDEVTEGAEPAEKPKPRKTKLIYTLRDVIKEHYRNLVEAEIPYKSSDKQYIASYQRAVTTVHEKMTDEDLQEANSILDEWNKDGGPTDVQLK
jgi:hypothetical protein